MNPDAFSDLHVQSDESIHQRGDKEGKVLTNAVLDVCMSDCACKVVRLSGAEDLVSCRVRIRFQLVVLFGGEQ